MFIILVWRDITVRYPQTMMGVAWAVIRPFLTMFVFTVVFHRLAKLPAPGAVPTTDFEKTVLRLLAATGIWKVF